MSLQHLAHYPGIKGSDRASGTGRNNIGDNVFNIQILKTFFKDMFSLGIQIFHPNLALMSFSKSWKMFKNEAIINLVV